jgi:hypothetical protein
VWKGNHEGNLNGISMARSDQQHLWWSGRFGYDQQTSVCGTSGKKNGGEERNQLERDHSVGYTEFSARFSQLLSLKLKMAFMVLEGCFSCFLDFS